MPDEPSLGEVVWRLENLEALLRDLSLRVVSEDVYSRDQRETDRRISQLERDLAAEREARKTEVEKVREQVTSTTSQSGTNVRQAIYSGLIPAALFLVSILINLSNSRGK